jgi:hypothetical protein
MIARHCIGNPRRASKKGLSQAEVDKRSLLTKQHIPHAGGTSFTGFAMCPSSWDNGNFDGRPSPVSFAQIIQDLSDKASGKPNGAVGLPRLRGRRPTKCFCHALFKKTAHRAPSAHLGSVVHQIPFLVLPVRSNRSMI